MLMANCWSWSLRGVIRPGIPAHPRNRRGWGIVLCVWPSKKVILQGGQKRGKMARRGNLWGLNSQDVYHNDQAGEILECPWSGQQSFRKNSLFVTSAHPPIIIRLMWKGPSISTNRQRSSISTATPRNNWWIETRAHQLKVVEYLLSLGYCFF